MRRCGTERTRADGTTFRCPAIYLNAEGRCRRCADAHDAGPFWAEPSLRVQ